MDVSLIIDSLAYANLHKISQVDPSCTSILLFPGQGSQFVGMGAQLHQYREAMDLYTIASDILKYDLWKICQEGPIDLLSKTEICQVAILVTSIAALVKLREDNPEVTECGGEMSIIPLHTSQMAIVTEDLKGKMTVVHFRYFELFYNEILLYLPVQ